MCVCTCLRAYVRVRVWCVCACVSCASPRRPRKYHIDRVDLALRHRASAGLHKVVLDRRDGLQGTHDLSLRDLRGVAHMVEHDDFVRPGTTDIGNGRAGNHPLLALCVRFSARFLTQLLYFADAIGRKISCGTRSRRNSVPRGEEGRGIGCRKSTVLQAVSEYAWSGD